MAAVGGPLCGREGAQPRASLFGMNKPFSLACWSGTVGEALVQNRPATKGSSGVEGGTAGNGSGLGRGMFLGEGAARKRPVPAGGYMNLTDATLPLAEEEDREEGDWGCCGGGGGLQRWGEHFLWKRPHKWAQPGDTKASLLKGGRWVETTCHLLGFEEFLEI